mgnify:CR=1 FL=1
MKKTYMTPAISVMAIETVLMSTMSRLMDCRPSGEPTMSDPTMESENQYSKEHTFDVWED